MSLMLSDIAGTRAANIKSNEIAAKTTMEMNIIHKPTGRPDWSPLGAKGVCGWVEFGVGGTRKVLRQQQRRIFLLIYPTKP
jgi:hypothetical protein